MNRSARLALTCSPAESALQGCKHIDYLVPALNTTPITRKSRKPSALMTIRMLINTIDPLYVCLPHRTGRVRLLFRRQSFNPRNGSFFDYKAKAFSDNPYKHRDQSLLLGPAGSVITLVD
ncbi:hypothetical protein [Nitrosomonas communis]|uniref:hypothetical protein n=1 Tax=Nitrosomonas communis TaxID=44574 RepID=UPI003D278EA5